MLRVATSPKALWFAWILCALVGGAAAWLVILGNPGNMGICGACFLRDTAGALGLYAGNGPRIFRPELVGLVFGAFLLRVVTWSFEGRAGSHAGAKFFLGVWMGIGAMVFLGCPFRMLQRLGGGDVNALAGLAGFILGVGVGKWLETGGYNAGKTDVVGAPAGMPGILFAVLGLGLFLWEKIPFGPKPGDQTSPPPHALWEWALGLATFAGAALSLTGFCAVSAARQVFTGPRVMLVGALFLVVGYGVTFGIWKGSFTLSDANQPVAHTEQLWNVLAMVLVGLTGVLAGGCPVRLIVLSGEGNSDAMVASAGILFGGALAHGMNMVSSTAGTTPMGRLAVGVGIGVCLAYGLAAIGLGRKGKASE